MKKDSKIRQLYRFVRSLGLIPTGWGRRFKAFPHFVSNMARYRKLQSGTPKFRLRFPMFEFYTFDKFEASGSTSSPYFWQDLWASMDVYKRRPALNVDIGSRIDGFIAHVLPFCPVEYVDIRPLDCQVPGLTFREGSILALPYQDASLESMSCLHVIEHIGLGRYGDPVDPDGYRLAAGELARCLATSGTLLLSTPVGRERVIFDAHRVFDPQTIMDAVAPLTLKEFHLIPDSTDKIIYNASFDEAREQRYACGIFVLTREPAV